MQKEKDIKSYAHIPIHQELISLVRTIDGLSVLYLILNNTYIGF